MKKKGFMLQELVLSFIFLIMFILINMSIYGNIAKSSNMSDRLTIATHYLIQALENVNNSSYASIQEQNRTPIIPNNFNYYITYEVEEKINPNDFIIEGFYDDDGSSAGNLIIDLTEYENMIKLVKITVEYKLPGQNEYKNISVTTIKVKESIEAKPIEE